MDSRAAKLALARKKLKDHQEKKMVCLPKDEASNMKNIYDEQQISLLPEDNSIQYMNDKNPKYMQNELKPDTKIDTATSQSADLAVNVTEMLISNKRNLEIEISELQSKLSEMDSYQTLLLKEGDNFKHQISTLENHLSNLNEKYLKASEEILTQNKKINELSLLKSSLIDENNNLQEQLEFTKTILKSKESEVSSLHAQISNLQNQLDVIQLQMQQLTNGSHMPLSQNYINVEEQNSEALLQKISNLEQQLKTLQKEKDQMNLHYEHYVAELNNQLKNVVIKNDDLVEQIHILSNRETSLIDQISDMEIRLQNYRDKHITDVNQINSKPDTSDIQEQYEKLQAKFEELNKTYSELQTKYAESEARVNAMNQMKVSEVNNENISISKLSADITSDKVAVQRATEQNKKLKCDLQELEEAFVKISRDKLELTEKLDAEKFLNRELTIKLAEIEEKAKDMYTKLIAKDEEMIRLQTSYRDIKKQYERLLEDLKHNENNNQVLEPSDVVEANESQKSLATDSHQATFNNYAHDEIVEIGSKIPKEDAMLKLQARFLKIMEEVADLSDEKHRLEHIILQLQNETETICEYVALYQQQRSLLKKRDEERSAQIKIFQSECELLRNQLEELSIILKRLITDSELSTYFEAESRKHEISKIMDLLSNLKTNSLIDPKRKCSELNDFYPCSCCSGKLIDV